MTSNREYKWVPGYEFPLDAIERMQNRFLMPPVPMGEAWFIGKERHLYTELIEQPFSEIEASHLSVQILFELASGTFSFGHMDEWDQWFKYLLPHLILRSHEGFFFDNLLLQSAVTSFMSIYWRGIPDEYPGFRDDVIDTLSLCLMNKELWFDHRDGKTLRTCPRARFLESYPNGQNQLVLGWNSAQTEASLSSMMFFCIKYLNDDEIRSWVKSLFEIDDVYWKGALSVWLLGALDMLRLPIVTPKAIDKANPKLEWDNSHVLIFSDDSDDFFEPAVIDFNKTRDFLPSENTKLFLDEVQKYLTDELIVEWADLFSTDEFVIQSTYTVPESLMDKLSKLD